MLSFYNVNDLGKNKATHTLDINVPGLLCPAGSSTLLYVDGQSSTPPEVCWLDCSTLPPNPIEDRKPINLPQELPLGDICVVNTDGKQNLVYASTTDEAGSGIFSYMITSKLSKLLLPIKASVSKELLQMGVVIFLHPITTIVAFSWQR